MIQLTSELLQICTNMMFSGFAIGVTLVTIGISLRILLDFILSYFGDDE